MSNISVPKGGGALTAIGETFQPELHTGAGTFTIPIPLPPGRSGMSPQLALTYSSGAGNGPFGLGWDLSTPRITRRTDRGVPLYDDVRDVFVLSGAEELAPVPLGGSTPAHLPGDAVATRYRPRTETGFARIVHVTGPADDYWDVWSRDGLRSRYGTARPAAAGDDWLDPATVRTPSGAVFSWLLSSTTDSFGSQIRYQYRSDGELAQRYLSTVEYADYGVPSDPAFAVTVSITHDTRPDPFSDRRPGFDLRTTLRAIQIAIVTVGSAPDLATTLDLNYADQAAAGGLASRISLLTGVIVTGHDPVTGESQALPPLTMTYRDTDLAGRRYQRLPDLPPDALGPSTEMADLFGDGLPAMLQLDGTPRFWRNRGAGHFDPPRPLSSPPSGARIGNPGTLITDVDGDGRPEVLISQPGSTAVWRLQAPATASATANQVGFDPAPGRASAIPSIGLAGPQLRTLDLDGDHVGDLLAGGRPAWAAFGDGTGGFTSPRPLPDAPPPATDLADPRVHLADMSGDGMNDVVMVRDGAVTYWPNLGRGRFGAAISMSGAPHFAGSSAFPGIGYDAARLFLADVTGDGAADVVHVDDGRVTVWLNRSGNGFAAPVVIPGTPQAGNRTTIRMADLLGIGISGVLWTGIGFAGESAFLDLTGGVKPYLLTSIDNHHGAITTLSWTTSTAFATADRNAGHPWRTALPFPVHVLASTRTVDVFSGTALSTAFEYHEGYWDPADREFRGFGRVEQIDTLTPVEPQSPSAPILTPLDPLTPPAPLPIGFDAAAHGNLLQNWSFDQPRSGGAPPLQTTAEHPFGPGVAAADGWTTWNNSATTTTTELRPNDLPFGRGGSMLHVDTGGAGCGVVQTFLPENTGPLRIVASVWIKVSRGSVEIGTGNGGNIAVDATLTQTGVWTLVEAGNHRSPANEIIIYAAADGGAEYDIDHAWVRVDDVPSEPVGSLPTRAVTWFHLGPVGPATGAWTDVDPTAGFWDGDPPLMSYFDRSLLPADLPRPALREAMRGLRGRVLRRELYTQDGDPVRGDRPHEVHDSAFQVVPVLDGRDPADPRWRADPVITVRDILTRTSTWDRGEDPLIQVTMTGGYDDYGRAGAHMDLALARGRDPRLPGAAGLGTLTTTEYATRDDEALLRLDRVTRTERHELIDPGTDSVLDFARDALTGVHNGDLRGLELTYYDGPAFTGLKLGELGDHALPVRSERLIVTPDLLTSVTQPLVPGGTTAPPLPYLAVDGVPVTSSTWTPDYPPAFQEAVANAPTERGPHLGYVWHDADTVHAAGYYEQTSRISYDVHGIVSGRIPRGLPLISRDAFGGDTTTAWDTFDLLPVTMTSPVGLSTRADYDYRVLKPNQVTDPNGNRTAIRYTPLGMPAAIARLGQASRSEGDTVAQPSEQFTYDFGAYDRSVANDVTAQPISVTALRRIDHRWTLVDAENARRAAEGRAALTEAEIGSMFGPDEPSDHPERFIRVVEFSDGFSRMLQTRRQDDYTSVLDLALPDDTSPSGAVVTVVQAGAQPAVIVSGWKQYDNKGRPVRTYEPFRAAGYEYVTPDAVQLAGLAAVTQHYDSLGRPTATVAPDGSQTRVVHGVPENLATPGTFAPTPWETYTYDANDNTSRTHPTEFLDQVARWDTPASITIDPLGRTVRHVQRGLAQDVVSVSTYDIDGHLTTVTDPLNRLAATTVYDLVGRPWGSWLLDAGSTRAVHDAADGSPETRDDKGALALSACDRAHRPILMWAADHAVRDATLRQITIYGDDQPASGLTSEEASAANARGRVVTAYDEAGVVVTAAYDLDGNAVASSRQVLEPSLLVSGLASPVASGGSGSWTGTSWAVDWQPRAGVSLVTHAGTLLDPAMYATKEMFDALGRRTSSVAPVDVTGQRATIAYGYGHGGSITSVMVDKQPYLSQILYDAHGRRSAVMLGNGVLIRYLYCPRTFRLRRVLAEHVGTSANTWSADALPLQDSTFRYDLRGSVLTVADRVPGSGIAPADLDSLDRQFGYDALDRLVSASGRETDTMPDQPWLAGPRTTDVTRARGWTETYEYDTVGNLLTLRHATDASGTGAYTRIFTAVPGSNRLAALTVGSVADVPYGYDACGNLTSEASNRLFEWDHANRLATFRNQVGAATPSIYAQYRYDATGQRVAKIVRRSSGPDEITLYIGGFERTLRGTIGGQLASFDEIHLTDANARLASIQRGAPHPDDGIPDQPVRYQIGDHLGSVIGTLDAVGALLNREEYLPYGETSFGSYARKRYRFTGKPRDEETGLAHFASRLYAPWTGRWLSTDPAGLADALTLYAYCRSDPIGRVDLLGRQSGAASTTALPIVDAGEAKRATPGDLYIRGRLLSIEPREQAAFVKSLHGAQLREWKDPIDSPPLSDPLTSFGWHLGEFFAGSSVSGSFVSRSQSLRRMTYDAISAWSIAAAAEGLIGSAGKTFAETVTILREAQTLSAAPPTRILSGRVLARQLSATTGKNLSAAFQRPEPTHNFPAAFADTIFQEGRRSVSVANSPHPLGDGTYVLYELDGHMQTSTNVGVRTPGGDPRFRNGSMSVAGPTKPGVYQIGVEPTRSGNYEIVTHWQVVIKKPYE